MTMLDWAINEVDLACRREAPNRKPGDWDYGCACYESALKAIKSLYEDGHSGLSIQYTKNILDRLLANKPLTPIQDEDFEKTTGVDIKEPQEYLDENNLISEIQCPRMSSLFKMNYKDGQIKYTDVDRVICQNKYDVYDVFSCGRATRLIDEMFPITMPYMPTIQPYKIITEEFLVDPKLGDWDTEAMYEIIKPDGEHVPINKFYKHVMENNKGILVEITKEEFEERKKSRVDRWMGI